MATMYRPAPQAKQIGDDLVSKWFPDLMESAVRIEYWFRSECSKRGGKIILGTCTKVSGRTAYLTQQGDPAEGYIEPKYMQYYIIELAEDCWLELTPEQRIALVDHELSHCLVEHDDDEGFTYKTVGHDVEEFAGVLQRHGLWKPDLQWFARQTAGQWALPFAESET